MERKCTLTLTANAGLIIDINESVLFIDALHHGSPGKYSPVNDEIFNTICTSDEVNNPSVLLYSHCHPDHFSEDMTAKFISDRKIPCIIPEKVFNSQILLTDDYEEFRISGFRILCFRLPHSGDSSSEPVLYGFVIEKDGIRILVPGDCETASAELEEILLTIGKIDIAVLNYPWGALFKGRRFIKEIMKPDEVLLVHIPFPEDDTNKVRIMLDRQMKRIGSSNFRLMERPLQKEEFFF